MATLSQLQARLSPRADSRLLDIGLDYLSELFFAHFVVLGGEAWFQGEEEDLRGILRQLLVVGGFLKIDVGVAVRRKYRNQCPRCRQKPCVCWNWEIKTPYRPYPGPLPREKTISELQEMLGEIFLDWHSLGKEVQHVRNEIAELYLAIERQDRSGVQEEVADVFARLCRVSNTLGISLDEQGPP